MTLIAARLRPFCGRRSSVGTRRGQGRSRRLALVVFRSLLILVLRGGRCFGRLRSSSCGTFVHSFVVRVSGPRMAWTCSPVGGLSFIGLGARCIFWRFIVRVVPISRESRFMKRDIRDSLCYAGVSSVLAVYCGG